MKKLFNKIVGKINKLSEEKLTLKSDILIQFLLSIVIVFWTVLILTDKKEKFKDFYLTES